MEGNSREVCNGPITAIEENFPGRKLCMHENAGLTVRNSIDYSSTTNLLGLESICLSKLNKTSHGNSEFSYPPSYHSEFNDTPSLHSEFNDTPSLHSESIDSPSPCSEINYTQFLNSGKGPLVTSSTSRPSSISGSLRLPNQLGSRGLLSNFSYGSFKKDQPNVDNDPPSTDPLAKHEWFTNALCENLSKMYAILLFMVGCVLYVMDILDERGPSLGEAFNVILIVVQLAWFGFIHIDVRRHINSVTSSKESKEKNGTEYLDNNLQDQVDRKHCESKQILPQRYGFTSGRHAGSQYLKIGAAMFCFGYLIHAGLNLAGGAIHYMSGDPGREYIQQFILSVLQPIYAFYQLFFIFKYSNLIINWRMKVSRFALMHCISSSLLFWIYTIGRETFQEIFPEVDSHGGYNNNTEGHSVGEGEKFSTDEEHNIMEKIHSVTPYLYPFSIEYNIFVVAFWILLWENIGKVERITENSKEASHSHNISVDCNKSNSGLFAGLLMMVASATSVILLYVLSGDEASKDYGLIINCYTEVIFLVAMIAASVLAFMKIRQLDVTKNDSGNIDNTILYICLPFIFLYSVFSVIPAITNGKQSFIAANLVQVLQPVIQTALISDGLRRCANSNELRTKKPGRGLITFLIIANIAHWLLETFQLKFEGGNDHKYNFYGKGIWSVLSHITLPVALFYRFHSSVCLVDIWKGGYEKDTKH